MPTAVQYQYFLVLGFTTKTPDHLGNATVPDVHYTLLCIGGLLRYLVQDAKKHYRRPVAELRLHGSFITFSSLQGSGGRIALWWVESFPHILSRQQFDAHKFRTGYLHLQISHSNLPQDVTSCCRWTSQCFLCKNNMIMDDHDCSNTDRDRNRPQGRTMAPILPVVGSSSWHPKHKRLDPSTDDSADCNWERQKAPFTMRSQLLVPVEEEVVMMPQVQYKVQVRATRLIWRALLQVHYVVP